MCLAIGHKDYARKGLLARQWWRIATHPVRLFSFLALFHLVVLLIMLLLGRVSVLQLSQSYSLPLLIVAILGGLMLGILFDRMPRLLDTSPIDYNIFGTSYNLSFLGLIALELSWFSYPAWSLVATGLLLLAWGIAVRTLFWSQQWTHHGPAWLLSSMMWSLYAILAMLALILMAQLSVQVSIFGLLTGFSILLLFALLVQYLLLLKLRA